MTDDTTRMYQLTDAQARTIKDALQCFSAYARAERAAAENAYDVLRPERATLAAIDRARTAIEGELVEDAGYGEYDHRGRVTYIDGHINPEALALAALTAALERITT